MTPQVSDRARRIAVRLHGLFVQDAELAARMNDAIARHEQAEATLRVELSPEGLRRAYGPTVPDAALSGKRPAVLEDDSPVSALEHAAVELRGALREVQRIAEDRRVAAVDVGEATEQLVCELAALGLSRQDAAAVDVNLLARGVVRIAS